MNTGNWRGLYVCGNYQADQKAEKKPEASSSRPALTDLNVNIAVAHEAPAPKKSPSKMKPFKALRRGMSKSLDLKECSVGFDAFKRERLQVAKDQKSNIVQGRSQLINVITVHINRGVWFCPSGNLQDHNQCDTGTWQFIFYFYHLLFCVEPEGNFSKLLSSHAFQMDRGIRKCSPSGNKFTQ